MNWAVIGFGLTLSLILPKLRGKMGTGKLYISGPIGFLVIIIGLYV